MGVFSLEAAALPPTSATAVGTLTLALELAFRPFSKVGFGTSVDSGSLAFGIYAEPAGECNRDAAQLAGQAARNQQPVYAGRNPFYAC